MWAQLALSYQQGDWYIYTMMLLAFFGLLIFFERIIMLQFVYHVDVAKFTDELRKMILAEDMNRAISYCKKVGSNSLPKISMKALEALESDPSRVRGVIEEESLAMLPEIEKRITSLPALATLLLLVGMLGSIDNLWETFNAVDVLDTAKKQATITQGIANSLTHAAFGLMCCILLFSAHQIIRSMALMMVTKLQHGVTVLTNLVAPNITYAAAPVAVAATATAAAASEPQESFQNSEEFVADASAPAVTTPATTESFNESAVDDIKDEEEII